VRSWQDLSWALNIDAIAIFYWLTLQTQRPIKINMAKEKSRCEPNVCLKGWQAKVQHNNNMARDLK
jgi:hypothetical protein